MTTTVHPPHIAHVGDLITSLIQLYQIPPFQRDDDWKDNERAIRETLNDEAIEVRHPVELTTP
ncbi:MAG TPA: hypothetical protein VMX14_13385 [Anaerolineae bacterium]|nr:hypothetical protein [Anaerolineae bacterium]